MATSAMDAAVGVHAKSANSLRTIRFRRRGTIQNPPAPTTMASPRSTVRRLDEPAARGVEALAEFFARLHDAEFDDYAYAAPHIVARTIPQTARAAERAWAVGSMVLARATGDASARPDVLLDAAAALQNEIASALREVDAVDVPAPPPPRGKRAQREARERALGHTSELLAEIALEEHGLEARLGAAAGGGHHELHTVAIEPPEAAARLLWSVLEFLELHSESSALIEMERIAAAWWFNTWSAPTRSEPEALASEFREREFSLVDRVMIALGEPLAAAAARHPSASELPRVQRGLLDALQRSVCGLFIVRERREAAALVEDVESGTRYDVREHYAELEYGKGFIVAGRLIPVEHIGWIRSPGAVMWRVPDERGAALLGDGLRSRGNLPRAAVVEAMISAIGRGEHVPRLTRPAASRRDAQEILYEFQLAMEDAGLAREAEVSALPPEMRALGSAPNHIVLETPMDGVLADWTRALAEQAGLAPGRPRPQGGSGKRKQGKRRKRKRR